jgi:hypothetical protein
MDNGLYSGTALVCQIHYNQIAGYQQSVIEQNKRFPKMYAWVVPARSSKDPNRYYMVPIRVGRKPITALWLRSLRKRSSMASLCPRRADEKAPQNENFGE